MSSTFIVQQSSTSVAWASSPCSRTQRPDPTPAAFHPVFNRRRHYAHGFTIVELLVAIAVFISVMAGVGLLFVNSVRVMRQGFQNQEAFEQARTTLNVLERDLSRAFTSRTHGDYYQFYGTPIGFTFVGLASPDPNDERPSNVARVTYVVYHGVGDEILTTIDDQERGTYRLLRLVESNKETLSDWPVDWESPLLQVADGSSPSLADQIVAAQAFAVSAGYCADSDLQCLELIENVKKRELWIRMLSGGDSEVPNAWYMDDSLVALGGLDPDDYQISDNVLYTLYNRNGVDDDGDGAVDDEDEALVVLYSPEYLPVISGDLVANFGMLPGRADMIDIPYNGIDEDGSGTADDVPATAFRPFFFTYSDYRVDQNHNTVTVPRRYWNDLRNLYDDVPGNGINDDGDGLIDEDQGLEFEDNGMDDDNDGVIDEPVPGNPFVPRLPQNVTSHFTLFFQSPYPGAPDFERTFDQNIDIPSGYRRLPAE